MGRQFFTDPVNWVTVDGATFNTTASETIIFPNTTLPGGFMADGRVLRVKAYGRYSNVVTAVPTITFAIRWGGVAGTLLCQSPAIVTSASAVTSAPWTLEAILQVRSNGSSGSIFAMGEVLLTTGIAPTVGTVANYGVKAAMSSTGTTVPAVVSSLDLSTDQALAVTGKFSASNASNGITGHILTIEALN